MMARLINNDVLELIVVDILTSLVVMQRMITRSVSRVQLIVAHETLC